MESEIKKSSFPLVFSRISGSLVYLHDYDLIVREIRRSRKERLADFKEVEVLSVAQMALQTGQNHLEANGIQVQVEKDADQLTVYHQGKVVLHVE